MENERSNQMGFLVETLLGKENPYLPKKCIFPLQIVKLRSYLSTNIL